MADDAGLEVVLGDGASVGFEEGAERLEVQDVGVDESAVDVEKQA